MNDLHYHGSIPDAHTDPLQTLTLVRTLRLLLLREGDVPAFHHHRNRKTPRATRAIRRAVITAFSIQLDGGSSADLD